MGKLNLLVVDDEPGIRSGVIRILENFSVSYPFMDEDFDYNVVEAPTGEDALTYLVDQKFDIVLLDNKLPGIQGIEVLEFINKKQLDVVVVMITSYASLDLAVKATRKGAYDFVPKPFTPKELRATVETITKQLFLRRMTQKLNLEGKQIRFQFLSVLSHELKAPINAIEGYLKMMQGKKEGDQIDDYMEMIDRSLFRVQSMRNLIMDMLDFTRIESGKKSRNIESIMLCEIAQQSIDSFQPLSIQKGIDIYLNCGTKVPIQADRQEIEIVLNNLISNSIKYNKEGGRVDVSLGKEESNAIIRVEDTGIGMNADDLDKLFEDFVRIKTEETKNISGSGLGLSIVKKILELYEADIKVESTPGEGSSFTVIFPIENQ
ncbi:MAG: ATP-binding protein [Bacteroides sp.]|jgi:signal transduction histidine kinase|nr:ATP-binding protein [Bacteroides sp.]